MGKVDPVISAYMAELARRRAESLTPEERTAIAKKASLASRVAAKKRAKEKAK